MALVPGHRKHALSASQVPLTSREQVGWVRTGCWCLTAGTTHSPPSAQLWDQSAGHLRLPILEAKSAGVSPKSFGVSTSAPKTMRALTISTLSFCWGQSEGNTQQLRERRGKGRQPLPPNRQASHRHGRRCSNPSDPLPPHRITRAEAGGDPPQKPAPPAPRRKQCMYDPCSGDHGDIEGSAADHFQEQPQRGSREREGCPGRQVQGATSEG